MIIGLIRHEPAVGPGYLVDALEQFPTAYTCHDVFAGVPAPAIDGVDGLVVLGGHMCANDDFPYLTNELKLIEEALKKSKAVLGICLGAQLLAKALGSRVYRNPEREIGWHHVYWTPEAQNDPLTAGLPDPITVMQWHEDTFDLPAGAVRLARSKDCVNQAFRFGSSAYGLQFHPEVTPEIAEEWCRQAPEEGVDPRAHDQRELAAALFGGWLGLVEGSFQGRPRRASNSVSAFSERCAGA